MFENLINDRFDRALRNIQRLNNILNDPNTAPEQRERTLQIYERYTRRFSPDYEEIHQRVVDSMMNFEDIKMVNQVLNQYRVEEEIFEKAIDGIKRMTTIKNRLKNTLRLWKRLMKRLVSAQC